MKIALVPLLVISMCLLPARGLAQQSSNAPVSAQAQSVADTARQNRPKDAKVTSQRVFTDDNFQHSTSQKDAAPTNVSTLSDSLEKARTAVMDAEGQTERQYAEGIVHDIQFPGRDDWEHRMYAQQMKAVAAAHALLDVIAANSSDAVIRSARRDFDIAIIGRNDLKAEGIAAAGKWARNR